MMMMEKRIRFLLSFLLLLLLLVTIMDISSANPSNKLGKKGPKGILPEIVEDEEDMYISFKSSEGVNFYEFQNGEVTKLVDNSGFVVSCLKYNDRKYYFSNSLIVLQKSNNDSWEKINSIREITKPNSTKPNPIIYKNKLYLFYQNSGNLGYVTYNNSKWHNTSKLRRGNVNFIYYIKPIIYENKMIISMSVFCFWIYGLIEITINLDRITSSQR